jgi:hypothetical protein
MRDRAAYTAAADFLEMSSCMLRRFHSGDGVMVADAGAIDISINRQMVGFVFR